MENYIYPFVAFVFGIFIFMICNRMLATSYKKAIEKPFLIISIIGTLFCAVDAAWGYLLTYPANSFIPLQVFSYLWHFMVCICSFAYTHYIVIYVGDNYERKSIIHISRIVLLVAQVALLIANIFTGILYVFNDGMYEISRTRYIIFIILAIYFVSGLLFTTIQLVQTRDKKEKRRCFSSIVFCLILLISILLQLVSGSSRVPIFSAAFSISAVVLYIFNLNDIRENQLHDEYDVESNLRKESLETIRILSSDYASIYYVDLETHKMTIYRISDDVANLFGDVLYKQVDFAKILTYYISQRINNSDKEDLLKYADPDYIKSILRSQEIYTHTYRVGSEEDFRYYQMKLVKVNDGPVAQKIILGIADIDDQVRQEKDYQLQLENAMRVADSASKAKTSFLFNMSHDIRTPMNAIIGFTDLARKHIDDKEKVEDCLTKVRNSSDHLLSLINDVLDMSRIESGKFNIVNVPTNLYEAIDETVSMLNVSAKARNIELTSNLNIKHPDLIMDSLHIGRTLINIIGNSIKYTNPGGHISLTVKETPSYEQGYATFTFICQDDGIGMEKKYVDHIFEAFTREETSTVSKIQGTGLGMAITKQLVDKLGGSIKVESEKGVGTTVTIVFDLEISDEVVGNKSEQSPEEIGNILNGKRVLLVEDNELNREIATAILEEQSVIVESAEDGTIAVDMVTANDPKYYDLVLMDIQMPKMNGYDATIKIRNIANGKYKDLLIIAMTANAFAEDKQHALEVGMNGHIAKPIDFDNLLSTLAKLLKQ